MKYLLIPIIVCLSILVGCTKIKTAEEVLPPAPPVTESTVEVKVVPKEEPKKEITPTPKEKPKFSKPKAKMPLKKSIKKEGGYSCVDVKNGLSFMGKEGLRTAAKVRGYTDEQINSALSHCKL